MKSEAKVVIIGGGVGGCSLLYHLAKLGLSDAVLFEKNELTSGSTWHAAGLCTQFNPSFNMMKLLQYSVELYQTLEAETGQAVDFRRSGSVRLACTEERVNEFRHRKGIADTLGLPFEIVSPERAFELFPFFNPEGVLAAAYLESDGYVDPTGVTMAFAKGARSRGAEIVRHVEVTGIERSGGFWLVRTSEGDIRAEIVVNAAGQWARAVGRLVGIDLPIVPLEHHFLVTEPIDEIRDTDVELPVLRDADHSYYVRREVNSLIVGPFERHTATWGLDGIPDDFHSRLLEPDLDRLEVELEAATKRVPLFADAGIQSIVNGPDGYTPDGRCLMGPVPGLPNYHVLAGFSIFGIVFGGGAGKYAAEWIVDGQPSDNMWEVDVRRFGDYARSTHYVAERAVDVYGHEYAIHYPELERFAGRPLKTGPLYDRLAEKGAVFGARFGWERPQWFASEPGVKEAYSFHRGNWHDAVVAESRAVRERVGVLDQTSFAKYEVSGPGATAFLDRMCANKLPKGLGRMALTQMCTPKGGIECDLTVTKLGDDHYYVVSAAGTENHDLAWIERHVPNDGSVRLDNVTTRFGVLTIAGPRSRDLLQALTRSDCSREAFRFFRCQELNIGMAPVRALRVSYVGELGYELHHPIEYQRHLYDLLMAEGEKYDIVDFGYRALDAMRLEKAYRLWGVDISADYTPIEAGLDRFVSFKKGDFIGRDALVKQREQGATKGLACLVIETEDRDAHGYEPVRSGREVIGYIAAGGYGPVVEKSIALAYLPTEFLAVGTELTVDLVGQEFKATVVEQPLYDPNNERLLS